jgi:hypothetical protein
MNTRPFDSSRRSDPALIAEETRKLVHIRGLSAITGLSDTTMVLAAAPITEKARMVFLTSGRDLATRADRVSELLQSTIDTSSSPSRAGLPMTSISVILSFTIVNRSALTNRPCGATTTPMAPSTSAGRVSRTRCP